MRRVLVDTGPLVAILSRADEHHKRCVEALRDLPGPLFSCWAVVTEAAWLLRGRPPAVQRLLGAIHSGFVGILPLNSLEALAIAGLMKRYQSIRPQLADVTLVYLADRDSISAIFTLDRRDFSVYRSDRRRSLRIVPEY